ncbi:lysM domain-containing GPI-anchored protein 2 [Mangifera indica]|uniref:lysM domain-containing GPI-anchored protein 2 n=1 Tax=Mangifera indica TaxID=29780 RepID=UPI001CF95403|nr:lysM domain-containing GPI-anchored protein 2 [Mangifera indica]
MAHMGSSIALLLLMIFVSTSTSTAATFTCNSTAKCRSLVGYPSPNTTSISTIQNLFNIKNLRTLLAANDLPASTGKNYTIQENQVLKIPIPCVCSNNTGVSDKMPVYTIKKDDGLYHIATDVFGRLVTSSEIQVANNIPNADLIIEGQNLTIPLPCSCDSVNNQKVVHYAHVVAEGSTLEAIAQQFGTNTDTLVQLNGNGTLKAGTAIDVPLQACNSSVKTDSLDSPLLVANGTSVYTANNCVKCKCDAANNYTLQCEPANLQGFNCSSMLCDGSESLLLGNTTISGCNQMTCAYAGYASNQTIFTTLNTLSTCPAPNSNNASKLGLNSNFVISIILSLLYLYLSR